MRYGRDAKVHAEPTLDVFDANSRVGGCLSSILKQFTM